MPPKQNDLPGMTDRKLSDLSDKAHEYAEIRDKRMALSTKEHELKQDLHGLMKRHKMKNYVFDDVEIQIVAKGRNG